VVQLPNHSPTSRRSGLLAAALALLVWGLALPSAAQDRRAVSEPSFPPACAVLQARLSTSGGEPSSETEFDTARIQTALNACPAGQAVELQGSGPATAFLAQPLYLPTGVTLLLDGGVTLFASRNPADYQVAGTIGSSLDACGTVGANGNGCKPLFTVNGNNTSSGAGLMGYGVIDGRGQDKLLVNGAVFAQSWWDLAAAANGNGSQNCPVLLDAKKANAFVLYKITLRNSPHFHVAWRGAGFTAWGVKIATPYTARNTDGIDPGGSDVTITQASISDGDDEIAVSASAASSYLTVSNSHVYSGHGISVGSYTQGGLTNFLVDHVSFAGTPADGNGNALRLKSAQDRGGLVKNVTYQNLCLKDVKHLIVLDPFYSSAAGTSYPQFSNVVLRNVRFLTEGQVEVQGYDAAHATSLTLDNVVFDNLKQSDLSPAPQYTQLTLGPGPVYPAFLQTLSGTGVTTTGSAPATQTGAYDCTGAFPTLNGELFLSTATATNLPTLDTTSPSFTLNAVVQTATSQVSYGAWTGTPALTGPIEFLENGAVVGSAALGANGTLASLALSAGGTHTYTARYPGDANQAAFSFGSVTVTVHPSDLLPSATALAAPTSTPFGGPLTLGATVTGDGAPSGTVSFKAGATVLGTAPLAGGSAQLSLGAVQLPPGSYPLVAVYGGDGLHAGSDSGNGATLTVLPAGTVTALQLPATPVAAGLEVALVATVTGQGGVPAGAVTFFHDDTAIDSVSLVNGQASLKVHPSSVGGFALRVAYAGGGSFAASSSALQTLQVVAPGALTATPQHLTLTSGHGSVALAVAPQGGFAGAVALRCTTSSPLLACALAAPSLTLDGAPLQTQVTLTSTGPTAALAPPRGGSLAALAPLAALLLWPRRRKGPGALFLCALLLAGALVACGGTAPLGPQTVTVTATANGVSASAAVAVDG
jgi:hypothetical protein